MFEDYELPGENFVCDFAVSQRSAGPMNLTGLRVAERDIFLPGPIGDDERRANRAAFLKNALDLLPEETAVPLLQHGCDIRYVQRHNATLEELKCDALITDHVDIALTTSFADCPPVILMDSATPVLGLIHGGWRPVSLGIVEDTLRMMVTRFGASASRVQAWIGPGIRKCCYEVGPEVATKVDGLPHAGQVHIDLSDIIFARLVARGVDRNSIVQHKDCTKCTVNSITGKPVWWSQRREKNDPLNAGMCAAVLG